LNNYLFGFSKESLDDEERYEITEKLTNEMDEIFYGKNINFGHTD
jgi:S-adenosylmethionine decarboxylase